MNTLLVGIGRRGGDCVSKAHQRFGKKYHILYADTDAFDLEQRSEGEKLLLEIPSSDQKFTRNSPDYSYNAALSKTDVVEKSLKNADVIILVAGLGGGTSAGAGKAIASIARKLGKKIITVATRPFSIEGASRIGRAQKGFRDLEKESDLVIPFFQDQLMPLAEKSMRVKELLAVADEFVIQALDGLTQIFSKEKELPEIKTGLFSFGASDQNTNIQEASRFAFIGPFFDEMPVSKSQDVLVNLTVHEELSSEIIKETKIFFAKKFGKAGRISIEQQVDPNAEHPLILRLFVFGNFGQPQPKIGDFFVPGPTG